MIWLNPLAWAGLLAIAAPIVIHILVQRRASPVPFPTLRFLLPTPLAAIRRHVLEDLPLLLVRAAMLAAAAGALAGPLLVTPARRAEWNARIARATVVFGDRVGAELARPAPTPPPVGAELARPEPTPPGAEQAPPLHLGDGFRLATFVTTDLRDGIARALAWLDAAPPARRELAIVSPFALGSLTRDDVRDVPADVGIRLVRSQPPPATRSFAGPPVLHFDTSVQWRDRTIELNGPSTSVRESAGPAAAVPIEIVAPPDVKRAADATLVAVLSRRVFAPAPGRAARVVFAGSKGVTPSILPPAIASWIADAIANITTDEDLQPAGRDPTPFIEASSDGTRLVVTTAWPAAGVRTAMLFRSILNTLALEPDATNRTRASAEREVLPIPDRDLRSWERLAAGVRSPRVETIERDDRRWWWAAALLLLAIETLIRRTQRPQSRQREPLNRVA